MGLFQKMFGRGKIPEAIDRRLEERRERSERISRVKKAKEEKERPKGYLNIEARKVSKAYGVSYEDALEYVKSQRKSAARKAIVKRVAGTLHEVGKRARQQTKERTSGRLSFQPVDITKSRLFPRR